MKPIINSLYAKYLAELSDKEKRAPRYHAIVGRDLATCVNFPAGYGKRRCPLIASWSRGPRPIDPDSVSLPRRADPRQDAAGSCRMRKPAISLWSLRKPRTCETFILLSIGASAHVMRLLNAC